jgi:hypothetical protein
MLHAGYDFCENDWEYTMKGRLSSSARWKLLCFAAALYAGATPAQSAMRFPPDYEKQFSEFKRQVKADGLVRDKDTAIAIGRAILKSHNGSK